MTTNEERIEQARTRAEGRIEAVLDLGRAALEALGGSKAYRLAAVQREEPTWAVKGEYGEYVRCEVGGVHIDTDDCTPHYMPAKTPADADRLLADAIALVRRLQEAVARDMARATEAARQFDESAIVAPKVGAGASVSS